MIKVLILDDSKAKVTAIIRVLTDSCHIPIDDIQVSESISQCADCLREEVYDLLILDLLVPLFDGEEPDAEESPRFINDLYLDPELNIPDAIMGMTEFDNQYQNLKQTYEDAGWLLVQYSQSDNDWMKKLKHKVFHIQKHKDSMSSMNKNKYDLGILCALSEEFEQMMNAFGKDKWKKEVIEGFPFISYSMSLSTAQGNTYKIIASCASKPGATTASIFSTMMYQFFEVDSLFMVGFSAGFKSKGLHLGDVVVASSVQDYASGKLVEESGDIKLLKEIQQLPGHPSLLSIADKFSKDSKIIGELNTDLINANLRQGRDLLEVQVAPTVCGPYVVASPTIMKELKDDNRKLQALDMEGFGLYSSAYFLSRKSLWIKGICDYADQKKKDHFHKPAAYASARFLYYLIKEGM